MSESSYPRWLGIAVIATIVCISPARPHPVGDSKHEHGCTCKAKRAGDGWCTECDVGYVAGVSVHSRRLFNALDLHGHEVYVDKTACPACRKAINRSDFCAACQMGFINGKGFFSRLCYVMAKGNIAVLRSEDDLFSGWDERNNAGRVGNRSFRKKSDYDEMRFWIKVLQRADEKAKQCEYCAVAMIANRHCHICKVFYGNGKAVERNTEVGGTYEQ